MGARRGEGGLVGWGGRIVGKGGGLGGYCGIKEPRGLDVCGGNWGRGLFDFSEVGGGLDAGDIDWGFYTARSLSLLPWFSVGEWLGRVGFYFNSSHVRAAVVYLGN